MKMNGQTYIIPLIKIGLSMNNYSIQRLHIEQLILSCFLNQIRTNELDQLEFREYKLPFELFKANKTNKLCAKAIFNLQEEKKPIDDLTVLCYIQKHMEVNQEEWLELVSNLWSTYDTMLLYLDMLKDLDEEEVKMKILESL